MMTKLCKAIKSRSVALSKEHRAKLLKEFTETELDNYNLLEASININKYADGRDNEFCSKIVKNISKSTTHSKISS